ncbi:MAG: helix-turn-helix domain-containing protein [Candidatus Bathyarchaeota archaeon]
MIDSSASLPLSGEAKEVLRELGLTQYETRAYLALLGKGALTASQISEYAEVPYSKVYEVLASLEKKGWTKAERGRPSKYYPKSPSGALEAAKLRLDDMTKSWERTILSELQPLYERRGIREKPDIWILRGEFSILAKLKETLDTAKKEVMIAAPSLPKTLEDVVISMLTGLQNAGVNVLFMISREAKDWNLKRIGNIAEVRVRDQMFGGGVIVDSREAMLFLGEEKPTLVIWSNHLGLVKFARDYFQYLWNSSEKGMKLGFS